MKYAKPLTQTLSTTYDDVEYGFECYQVPKTIKGMNGSIFPKYDKNETYNVGNYVVIDELKRVFRCTKDNTKGVYPPSDAGIWLDYGFINSYKMFAIDEQIGDSSVGKDVEIVIEFNRLNTLALLDIDFVKLEVKQTDNDNDDEVLYEETISGKNIGATSLAEYMYEEYGYITRVILDNLVWHPNSTLTLKFESDVSIGTLVVGNTKELGLTLYGTSLRFEDKSLIENSKVNNTRTVRRYGHIRVLTATVQFDTANFNKTAQNIAEIIGKNTLFVPTKNDKYNEMNSIAYIENFDMPVDNPEVVSTQITLIGVVKR